MSTPSLNLEGRNIIVTGAGAGIGRSVVDAVLAHGGIVTAIELGDSGIAALEEIGGDRLLILKGNVTDPDFVTDAIAQSAAKFGAVHGLVNNAGITRPAMIEKMALDDWRAVIDVNLTGAFLCLQAVGRHMLARARAGERNPGAIVNVSSDAGRRGTVGQINYGVSKSGILGLTMSAAREWGRYGVRVNSICFGVVETAMTETIRQEKFRDKYLADIPLGRFMEPEEAARSICMLLSEYTAYMTGQHVSVSGGLYISA
jgi:3-oxoacyl-[acyl-carrier protein] reductase